MRLPALPEIRLPAYQTCDSLPTRIATAHEHEMRLPAYENANAHLQEMRLPAVQERAVLEEQVGQIHSPRMHHGSDIARVHHLLSPLPRAPWALSRGCGKKLK